MRFKYANYFWSLLGLSTLAAGLSTLAGFLGRLWWLFELFSHFRTQYFIFLISSAIVFIFGKKFGNSLVAALFALLNLPLVVRYYFKPTVAQANGQTYRLLSVNLLQKNTSYAKVRQLIGRTNPDLILLLEISQAWMAELRPVLAAYPYSCRQLRNDNYGIAFFSRLPCLQVEIINVGPGKRPSVFARCQLDGTPLVVIGTHPPPPLDGPGAVERNRQLANLACFVRGQDGEVILAGDLNITSWSPHFQDLIRQSGLRDSRVGFGIQPTWPTNNPLLFVPIDHVLVSEGINIQQRQTGPYTGSDHLPVILDFSLDGHV